MARLWLRNAAVALDARPAGVVKYALAFSGTFLWRVCSLHDLTPLEYAFLALSNPRERNNTDKVGDIEYFSTTSDVYGWAVMISYFIPDRVARRQSSTQSFDIFFDERVKIFQERVNDYFSKMSAITFYSNHLFNEGPLTIDRAQSLGVQQQFSELNLVGGALSFNRRDAIRVALNMRAKLHNWGEIKKAMGVNLKGVSVKDIKKKSIEIESKLIERNLIQDPFLELGAMAVVLGAAPYAVTRRTKEGEELYLKIKSALWEYERSTSEGVTEHSFYLAYDKAVSSLKRLAASWAVKSDGSDP